MSDYRREIAKIESTRLGYEDHGIFTCLLHVTYGGGLHQGIGDACLDDKPAPGEKKRRGTAFGHEWIARILRACGVDYWEKLPGRTIYVLTNPTKPSGFGNEVVGIEPLPTEPGEPFIFADLSVDFGREAA